MKLNRTGSNWNELERSKINENWRIIEGNYNDVVGQITDEVVGHLIDSAKLIWKEPVDTVEDLPANAEVGETRMVREADPDGISYVYRFDGEKWEKIQEIDVTLINEVDRRLTAQLAEEVNQRRSDVRYLGENKANKNEVRKITDKLTPEDLSEETLALITGEGEINLESIPQDNSVTMPKFEPTLRQDFQDLFNAFVNQDDFIPIELFDGSKVRQGGATSSGITNSLTRTHIEIEVHPGKEYYVTIPNSEYLRVRSITSWNDNKFLEWNQFDSILKGNSFSVPSGADKAIISFCKVDINEELTPEETYKELVSIFELRFNPRNLITSVNQGGITESGRFTENDSRTRTDKIPVEPLTVYRVSINESSDVIIRNISGYTNDGVAMFILPDGRRKESKFTIPEDVIEIAVSFAKDDTSRSLTPNETLNANPKLEEAYK